MMLIPEIARRYQYNGQPTNATHVVADVHIGGPDNPNQRFNVFVAYVTFMFGDADGYETLEVDFPLAQQSHLVDFINFCSRCADHYPNGKGGYDDYRDVAGYAQCVWDDEVEDEEDDPKEERPKLFYWPMSDGEYYSSFEKIRVVFFDENGDRKIVQMSVPALT